MSKTSISTTAEQPTVIDGASEFVAFFAAGWRIGATDPDAFFDHFGARLHPSALMVQPLAPDARGEAEFRMLFAPLFRALPDLRGEVLSFGPTADGVLIELELSGTLAGKPLRWTVVDRLVLDEGLIRERRSYFDPLPLVKILLTRPRASLPLLAGLLRRREMK